MLDVQSQRPRRQIAIDQVGISDFIFPIKIKSVNGTISTNAHFSFSCSLESHERGTHMSRLILLIHKYQNKIFNYKTIVDISEEAKESLKTKYSTLSLSFDYFIKKSTPVSKMENIVSYKAALIVKNNHHKKVFLKAEVPITAVCPCSKEISEYGAHNQRGKVKVVAEITDIKNIWLTDLIKMAENAASSEVYSVLKRPDEKYVTEKAYNNAAFVEDIVREMANSLNGLDISNYQVVCTNYESIHNHNAFAQITKGDICI